MASLALGHDLRRDPEAEPSKPARGRPRKAPGAPTHRVAAPPITLNQAVAISDAFNLSRTVPDPGRGCFAEINTFLTVRWSRTDGAAVDAPALIREFFSRTGDFMRYHRAPLVHVYVRENGWEKGDHMHAAIYVPRALAEVYAAKVKAWVATLLKAPASDAVDIGPVNPHAGGLPGLVRYFVKEGTDEARKAFDVHHPRNGLPVYGRRWSICTTLRRAASERPSNVIAFPSARCARATDRLAA